MADPDTEKGRAALAAVEAAWNEGAGRWDPVGLTAVYTADAVFHGGRPGHAVGATAIRAYFDSYVGTIESARLELVEQVMAQVGPRAWVAQGYANFSFVLTGGQRTRSVLRTTLTIVRQDGWRIRQHHFSPTPDAPPLGRD